MLRNLIGKLRSFMIKLKYFKSKTLEYSYSDTVLSGRKIMLRHFPVSQLREHWEDTSTKVKISSKKLCLPSLTSFHYLIHKWNLEEKFGFSWENFLRHQGTNNSFTSFLMRIPFISNKPLNCVHCTWILLTTASLSVVLRA